VVTPSPGAGGFAEAVRAQLGAGGYLTALPTSDEVLLALGAPVRHLVDKIELSERARAAGFEVPGSRIFDSGEALQNAAAELDYPVVVKPSIARQPARRAGSPAGLAGVETLPGPLVVQPFVGHELRAVAGIVWRGQFAALVHNRNLRIWPPDCGGACAAVTTEPDHGLEERVLALLDGYEGIFHVQLAGPYLIDVNPRVFGSLPLAVRAGANLPALYCDLVRGGPARVVRGRPGVFYRWLEGDLRRALRALRDRKMAAPEVLRALRPRRRAAHGPESLTDPGPLLARFRYAARVASTGSTLRSSQRSSVAS
jgi:predicted ATP-grasp superfamily ATP-dependent carboligase